MNLQQTSLWGRSWGGNNINHLKWPEQSVDDFVAELNKKLQVEANAARKEVFWTKEKVHNKVHNIVEN